VCASSCENLLNEKFESNQRDSSAKGKDNVQLMAKRDFPQTLHMQKDRCRGKRQSSEGLAQLESGNKKG
jgi:hypothetical protein